MKALFWQLLNLEAQSQWPVRGLCADSRRVQPGDIFVALGGLRSHGAQYAEQAVAAGAVLVISESSLTLSVPVVVVPDLSERLPQLVAAFYDLPAAMRVVAITGTNGKTSTCHYLAQLLVAQNHKVAVIGTTGNGIWPNLQPSTHTTPDLISLFAQLYEFADQGCDLVVMEASSHALDQGRLGDLKVDLALFTNLSQDHLDYHPDFEHYFAAKKRLFTRPEQPKAIVNIDDAYGQRLATELPAVVRVSCQPETVAELHCLQAQYSAKGVQADIHTQAQAASLHSPLLGAFNAQNLCLALAAALELGKPLASLLQACRTLKAADGRMQRMQCDGQPLVVIDYAHTPDALLQAIEACRLHCVGRLWVVVGCGGDRDVGKRPLMAQIAEEYADQSVFTSDNPRSENPLNILNDMSAGLSNTQAAWFEQDRKQAIAMALAAAKSEDLVLIAGKGHEDYQEIKGQRFAFSDQQVVQECWGMACKG